MSESIQTRLSALHACVLTATVALLAGLLLLAPPAASASTSQVALFEDDQSLAENPVGTLRTLRSLGVGEIRMYVHWNYVAPAPSSATRPAGFNAVDPAAYPAANWARFDAIVRGAKANGIGILLMAAGGAPRWATGQDQPGGGPYGQWKPSASEYEQFVRALGIRYSGIYQPAGSASALPRVDSWEIWNEPNWGQALAPQAIDGSRTPSSPLIYRDLLDAGWNALQGTGHGRDTVVVGSLSPRGFSSKPSANYPLGLPGDFSTMKPLQFVRSLYCVDSNYRALRGSAASALGCPTTASAALQFGRRHPALFGASGFGIHPYPFSLPPTRADSRDPDYVEFNEIPRLQSALDRLLRSYGSHRRLQIYNTEYGYETNPPNRTDHFVSPNTAAAYTNWAEYLSWRNPRLATTMQYLLNDPNPKVGQSIFGFGSFAAGLVFYHGAPKADYYAYRMPMFLPFNSTSRNRSLEVWGSVRPAHFALGLQRVQIQFRRGSRGRFTTLSTVAIRSSRGYFDVRVAFPASGSVRTAWTPPSGGTIYSRTDTVRVR